ncbi:hypothetical protein A1OE_710 [Candidatus Endolissoclinum faulkneri L2]|uniref:Uncharacterized protein n=1 Tax=Candidatus Endolissoclinum faulkneri L2 TaxID=1193729 RepID=K7Z4G0_9PROT|nr:hypothetical protein A1OE_710 [Candidatus Endolissoclinum faulkneri L2]
MWHLCIKYAWFAKPIFLLFLASSKSLNKFAAKNPRKGYKTHLK